MITFDPREPAPLSVRWARVIVPLAMCFSYLTLRVAPAAHERISLAELLASGALFVGLTFVSFVGLGDLLYPATPAEKAVEDDPEFTSQFAAVPAMSPVEEAFQAGWFPSSYGWPPARGDLRTALPGLATSAALLREAAETDVMTGDTEELELLTHEYAPLHHTPPRGFPRISEWPPTGAQLAASGTVTGRVPTPEPRTAGRHRREGRTK